MSVRFTRILHRGQSGVDVEGVGRALCDAGVLIPIRVFAALPAPLRRRYGARKIAAVKRFQKRKNIRVDGVYGLQTHERLTSHFDAKAQGLMSAYVARTPQDEAFDKLLAAMREFSDHTPGYLWGGGHGVPLKDLSPYQALDCSSSTSVVLWKAGLFSHDEAWVSGQFESYGEAGEGTYFTIYASAQHVWVRLHKSRFWRFDTSPHGDGGQGPKLRYLPRFTSGFVARHAKGF